MRAPPGSAHCTHRSTQHPPTPHSVIPVFQDLTGVPGDFPSGATSSPPGLSFIKLRNKVFFILFKTEKHMIPKMQNELPENHSCLPCSKDINVSPAPLPRPPVQGLRADRTLNIQHCLLCPKGPSICNPSTGVLQTHIVNLKLGIKKGRHRWSLTTLGKHSVNGQYHLGSQASAA